MILAMVSWAHQPKGPQNFTVDREKTLMHLYWVASRDQLLDFPCSVSIGWISQREVLRDNKGPDALHWAVCQFQSCNYFHSWWYVLMFLARFILSFIWHYMCLPLWVNVSYDLATQFVPSKVEAIIPFVIVDAIWLYHSSDWTAVLRIASVGIHPASGFKNPDCLNLCCKTLFRQLICWRTTYFTGSKIRSLEPIVYWTAHFSNHICLTMF